MASKHRIMPALCLLFFAACIHAQGANPSRVAVLEFEAKGDIGMKDGGTVVADWMSTALAATGAYEILERSQLDKLLEEQSLSVSGMIDEATSVRIGQLSGAQAIVAGSLVKWGATTTLTARLIDLASGKVLQTASYRTADVGRLSEKMGDIARVLAGQLPKEGLSRDSVPVGKPGSATTAAISVVRATPKEGSLRVVLDRGSLDGMERKQCYAILMPVYGVSEISGTRVRTGMRRVGSLEVSYVEPDYAAGDFLPEMGVKTKPAELVAEAIALPLPPIHFGLDLGSLNAGGYYGLTYSTPAGIFGFDLGYEAAIPALQLNDGGFSLGFKYEKPALGNFLSGSRSGPGVELFFRMLPDMKVGQDDSVLLFGGGAAAYWQLKLGRFQARLGARADYCFGTAYVGLVPIADDTVTVFSVEPFLTLGFAMNFMEPRI